MGNGDKANHVVMAGQHALCAGCGTKYDLWPGGKPREIWEIGALTEAFVKQHRGCAEAAKAAPRCDLCGGAGHDYEGCNEAHGLTKETWINGHDTGISSKTIWHFMFGVIGRSRDIDGPHDPADFGRCYRLLRLAPEWRARMPEMVTVGGWAGIAEAWEELTALYEKERKRKDGNAPKLFKRLSELRGHR